MEATGLLPSPEKSAEGGAVLPFPQWLEAVTPQWRWSWPHLRHIQAKLDLVTSGAVRKLMLFLPPRHGKSEQTTIRYPVWRLERDPQTRVCVACYNKTFAAKFGRKARRVARQRHLSLSPEKNTANEWETVQGGVYRSCGVGVPPTGEGFDLLVIDDPIKSREEAESKAYRERAWEWFKDDLYTRLEPSAAVILIQTRWHVDDLAGRILNSEDAKQWTVINLPAEAESNDPLGRLPGTALCPERYDEAALADIRRVMGLTSYLALYQGRPVPREGALFKRHWWVRYHWMRDHYVLADTGLQIFPHRCFRVVVMDPAGGTSAGADNTAITVWDIPPDRRAVLRHVYKARVDVELIPKTLKDICDVFRPLYCLVEAAFLQTTIIKACRKLPGMPAIRPVDPGGKDKYLRAVPAIINASEGRILVPADNEPGFGWLEEWLTEHDQFTGNNDAHDDQVDCTAYMALDLQAGGVGGVGGGALPMAVGERYQ